MTKKVLIIVIALAVIIGAVAYVGTMRKAPTQTSGEVATNSTTTTSIGEKTPNIKMLGAVGIAEGKEGEYIVNSDGLTLYTNNLDGAGPNPNFKNHCDTTCEKTWIPYVLNSTTPSPVSKSDDPLLKKINVFKRKDGQQQYAIGTSPLYTFSTDKKVGDQLGKTVENWSVAKP